MTDTVIQSLLNKVERVSVRSIDTHPQNPRQGDIDAVAESLKANGQFRPLVVQKSTKRILCGNHTYLAARRLGWTHIDVVRLDVSDEQATRIMLADNRTADSSTYDEKVLAEILMSLPDATGTGYDQAEIDELIQSAQAASRSIEDYTANMPTPSIPNLVPERERMEREDRIERRTEEQQEADRVRGSTPVTTASLERDREIEQVKVDAELQATLEFKEQEEWKGSNFWNIPELREDMLITDVAPDMVAWGGPDAFGNTGDRPGRWYAYTYGLGGTRDLPTERTLLCFNGWDDKFENFWSLPSYYTARMLKIGIRNAVCPDFSFYEHMPRCLHLHNVYRSQWLGRFFQEAGMKVMPRVQFYDLDSFEFNLLGIPQSPPVMMVSAQNFGAKEDELAREKVVGECTAEAIKRLTPGKLLIYGAPKRLERLTNTYWKGLGTEIQIVPNYSWVRKEAGIFGKPQGLAALPAKERNKIKAEVRQKLGVPDAKPAQLHPDDEDE